MTEKEKFISTVIDFVTGEQVPDIGAESNRQALERILVNTLGYEKKDVAVDVDIEIGISGEPYRSQIDLVVSVDGVRFMAVKCAAGSLGSREREILAAARLLDTYQIPLSIVSDGKTAIILDTVTGKKIGEGLHMIPTKAQAHETLQSSGLHPLDPGRREREKLIFRSYDSMNVNVRRNFSVQ
ncbi:MAG: type I restriction enzyme HsdR N-terminal domain-containing protein [Desulfobacterales bacterium]|nr:type I restriction enzyme HsdR N-terminal domain-containing protein [Desulfobacterales bacterium]